MIKCKNITLTIKLMSQDENTYKRKNVMQTSERRSYNPIFFVNCYMAVTQQYANKEMRKCQSNIASKPATGMQGYTMTKNKHLL